MKRAELEIGQKVVIKQGTSYVSYYEAIVVDTAPWKKAEWSGRCYPAEKGSGVAVARTTSYGLSRNHWRPDVIQLRQLITAEQKEAQDAEAQRKREQKTEQQERRRRQLEILAERISSYTGVAAVIRRNYNGETVVSVRDVERLLAKLDQLTGTTPPTLEDEEDDLPSALD